MPGLIKNLAVSFWPGRIPFVLLLTIAGCCATILYTRVYTDFERVRVRVVTTERASSQQAVVVSLPDLSGLAEFPTAVVLRLENRELVDRMLTFSVNGIELGHYVLRATGHARVDLRAPINPVWVRGDLLRIEADGDGWLLHSLELANIHGFSSGAFSFVITPSDNEHYESVSGTAALVLFGALLLCSLPLLRLGRRKNFRVSQIVIVTLVLGFFAITLMATAVSDYKVLLSAQAFWICVAAVYFPVIPRLYVLIVGLITSHASGTAERLYHVQRATWEYVVSVRIKVFYLGAVAIFLVSIGGFYSHETGFTSLIVFGSEFQDRALPVLRSESLHVNEGTGYDGQFYAQLAIDPLLLDPAIESALDSFPYRSRRILFSWTAFLLGLGQPPWILQAYAVQNIICWLALAFVLLRWLPPIDFKNFFLWFGCLFCHGLIFSVRDSLLEGPSLLILALTIVAIEGGRRWLAVSLIGLSGLGRATNLLSVASLFNTPRRGVVLVTHTVMICLPLALWVAYVHGSYPGLSVSTGTDNFGAPFSGLVEKLSVTLTTLRTEGWASYARFSLLALVSLTTQAVVLTFLADWRSPWWRVGMTYGVLMVVLGSAVWAGSTIAATRVLLPMTCAFNILLPRNQAFWPLAVLGNLTVVHGLEALRVPFVWEHL